MELPEWFKQGEAVFLHERNGFGRVQDGEGTIYTFHFRSFRHIIAGFLHPVFAGKSDSRSYRRPVLGDRLIFTIGYDRRGPRVALWSYFDEYASVEAQMRAPKQLVLV